MKIGISEVVNGTKDFSVTNDINGNVIATVTKGDNQLKRLRTALREEFSSDKLNIVDVEEEVGNGITFDIKLDEGGFQSIRLLTAVVY